MALTRSDELFLINYAIKSLMNGIEERETKIPIEKIERNTRPVRRKPVWSAAQKKAAAIRMKKYWASRRKTKK